jgi:hypothetical protein
VDAAVRDLIVRLHAGPYRYVLSATGGGAGVAGWLLSVPGGSRTVLEITVPYSEEALSEQLGRPPASSCSAETARAMAFRAHERARWLAPGSAAAGIGCTASLCSDRPKRGDHRFHVAAHTGRRTLTHSLTLTKESRDREGEELIVDLVLLNLMAEAFGLNERVAVPLLPGEEIGAEVQAEDDALSAFLAGKVPALRVEADGRMRADAPAPKVLLPGSFNPLHEGHLALAEVAGRLVGAPAAFELSAINADKPPLSDEEVRRRLCNFANRAPVWLTRAPTFAEKARLFPGAVFVVGADTAARIVAPRFYENSEAKRDEALAAVRERGCRFLVAGRVEQDGTFVELDRMAVPATVRDLFEGISREAFRLDISSTALRAQASCP